MKITLALSKVIRSTDSITVDSLYAITDVDPNEYLENFQDDPTDVYRIAVSVLGDKGSVLRYGHDFPNNKGCVKIGFKKPITLVPLDSYKGTLDLGQNLFDPSDFEDIEDLLMTATSFKVVYNGVSNRVQVPSYVQDFVDTYLAVGTSRYSVGSPDYLKQVDALADLDYGLVKDWYHTIRVDKKLKVPDYVYRGIYLASDKSYTDLTQWKEYKDLTELLNTADFHLGDRIDYTHYLKTPISTSTSLNIATDFMSPSSKVRAKTYIGIVLKFQINPGDILIDTRLIENDHPTQSEIVLDPSIEYKPTIRKLELKGIKL